MTAIGKPLSQVEQLTPLPDTVLRLVHVLNLPHSTVEDIVECIQYDPVVTADVLRLCNSAFAGMQRVINSIHEATRYLGTMRILQLVLARHAGPLLAPEQAGYGLAPGLLWRHSVAVALAAAAFAKRINAEEGRLAFTAGLLHDIGKIVLNERVGRSIDEILRIAAEHQLSFAEAEQRVLHCSHEEIGAELAESWKLPEPIIRSIRHHHNPEAVQPPDTLVDIVYLANAVCIILGIGVGADELLSRAESQVLTRHGLTEADCEQVGIQTLTELRAVEELFSVPGVRR
jgi:putative nucleotidyltransferase with HDIG domain